MKEDVQIIGCHTGFQNITYRYAIYKEIKAVIQDEISLIPINHVTNIFALDNNVVPDRNGLVPTLFEV